MILYDHIYILLLFYYYLNNKSISFKYGRNINDISNLTKTLKSTFD